MKKADFAKEQGGCVTRLVSQTGVFALSLAAMLAAGTALAGWEEWQKPIYGATFQTYAAGQALSNTGAVNGAWSIPDGTDSKAVWQGKSAYMKVSTPDDGVVFTPTDDGARSLKSIMTKMLISGFEELPVLSDNVRSALAIYAPEGGNRVFVGWGWSETANKFDWQELYLAEGGDSLTDGWRDVSIRFVRNAEGHVDVQYRIVPNGKTAYATLLRKSDDAAWMLAGGNDGAAIVGSVEFRGNGAFYALAGSEPQRGLLAGTGNWYETLFDETVVSHNTGEWESPPVQEGDNFVFSETDEVIGNNEFRPSRPQDCRYVTTKVAARFNAPNTDDSCPDDVCARVRLVEYGAETYRFACLVGGAWITNKVVEAKADSDYTVEVVLDKVDKKVSYRVKEGFGAEGGTNMLLYADGDMPAKASGAVKAVAFSGTGLVREIKGQDKSGAKK